MIENIEQDVQRRKKQWDKITSAEETNTYSVDELLWIRSPQLLLLLYIIINSRFFSVFKQIKEFKTCLNEVKSLIVLAS